MVSPNADHKEENPEREKIRRQLRQNLSRDLSPDRELFQNLFREVSGNPAIAEESEALGFEPGDNTYRYYLFSRFLDRVETLQEQIAPPGVRGRLVLNAIPPTCASLEFWNGDPRQLIARYPNSADIVRRLAKRYTDQRKLPAPLSENAALFIAVNRVYRKYNPDEEPCLLDEIY